MKLAPLAFALVIVAFPTAHAAESTRVAQAATAEKSTSKLYPPQNVVASDLDWAARKFNATFKDLGMVGARIQSRECFSNFSGQPSWMQLDRCIAFDYITSSLNPGTWDDYYKKEVMFERWNSSADHLDGGRDLLSSHVRQIVRNFPWKSIRPAE